MGMPRNCYIPILREEIVIFITHTCPVKVETVIAAQFEPAALYLKPVMESTS